MVLDSLLDANVNAMNKANWDCWQGPVTGEPEVLVRQVQKRDEFMILATDGIWDVMTDQEAVNLVRHELGEHGDLKRAARALVDKAVPFSEDNMTALLIGLNQQLQEQEQEQANIQDSSRKRRPSI
jgi:serine/threonine protein phosphatase PrpC